MPSPTSQADIVLDWRGLLDSTGSSPEVLEVIQAEHQALGLTLEEVNVLLARKNELRGQSQEVTQKLLATLVRGKELAIQIRSIVRGKLGPKNERLVQHKVAPIRRRPRKSVVKPPEEAPPDTEPGVVPVPTEPVV